MDVNWREFFDKVNKYKQYLLGLAFVLSIFAFYLINQKNSTPQVQKLLDESIKQSSSSSKYSSSQNNKIYIDIKGAVNNPGVYQLNSNLLVDDAIKAAGGITADADLDQINLAQKIQDEMVIYVPRTGEDNPSTNQSGNSSENSKVNINTADVQQLQTLNGIGQKKAEMIVDYRNKNGNFKSVDDLINVQGLGAKTVDNLRDQVTV